MGLGFGLEQEALVGFADGVFGGGFVRSLF